MQTKFFMLLTLVSASAIAHEGHGPDGPHLHGWDSGATLALVAVAALAVWWFAKGRK